ncbi:MAG: hypothetical protein RL160_1001 [Bacteroidota bacterium]
MVRTPALSAVDALGIFMLPSGVNGIKRLTLFGKGEAILNNFAHSRCDLNGS